METTAETDTTPGPASAPVASRAKTLGLKLALLVAVIIAALLTAQFALPRLFAMFGPHSFAGTTFSGDVAAAPLDGLLFDDGQPASLSPFEGDVVMIYFGYTYCPDVCPTTLDTAARAIEGLGDDGDDVHLIMVTVDPERDGLGSLGEYVRFFNPGFLGAGGEVEAIDRVASAYGVFYQLDEPAADGSYAVNHTASLFGIDRNGNLAVVWPPTVERDDLRDDLKELL